MTAVAERTRVDGRFIALLAGASLVPWLAAPLVDSAGVDGSTVWVLVLAVFGVAHVGTTAAFYLDPEARPILAADRSRYFVWPAIAVTVALVVGLAAPVGWRTLPVAVFGMWQLHHFTRQNLGCLAFLCRARMMPGPTADERRMLDLTTVAAALAAPFMLVNYDGPVAVAMHLAGLLVLVPVGMLAVRSMRANRDPVRWVALTFAASFYLPLFLFGRGTVAVGGYGLAHGAQYLLMMSHLPAGRRSPRPMLLAVAGSLAVVGAGVAVAGRHEVVPVLFAVYFGLIASHIIVDAGVWKMRTPLQRDYMRRRFSFL